MVASTAMSSVHRLQVVITRDCVNCGDALRLVRQVALTYPDLQVEIIDLERDQVPEPVFAVPTYLLDGRIISLGNPTREGLEHRIEEVLNGG